MQSPQTMLELALNDLEHVSVDCWSDVATEIGTCIGVARVLYLTNQISTAEFDHFHIKLQELMEEKGHEKWPDLNAT